MWKQTSDSCNSLTTVTLWMWNTHSSLFCFTSRLFATFCYWPVTLPAGGRRRQDGAMRAIKDQHRQRASLVSTDGAKVGQFPLPCKENGLGWKLVKEKVKEVHFFTFLVKKKGWKGGFLVKVVKVLVKEVHFSPLLVKVRDSLVKVLVKTFVRIRREGGGLLKIIRWSLPKKQDATPAPPALDPQNSPPARHRFTGIIQSGHYVIMSSCRYVIMPLRILLENAVYGLKEIVYIIFILYILFLWLLISLFP